MDYEAYLGLIRSVDVLIEGMATQPDEKGRARVEALLSGLDALHREGLERLVERLKDFGGQELVERLTDDPVVKTLLALYDLAELDVPGEEVAAADGAHVGFVPLSEVKVGGRPVGGAGGSG